MAMRVRGTIGIVALIYLVVGVVLAWQYDYLTPGLLRLLLSGLLAIILWPLVLLGVGLHLR